MAPHRSRQRRLRKLEKFRFPTAATAATGGEAHEDVDEDADLRLAVELSMQPLDTPIPAANATNSLWMPPRYLPTSSASEDKTLRLVESVQVRDGGFAWQPATAFLDTGNQHMTIIDTRFAARHAIFRPDAPQGVFTRAERWTTLHGVVPGASSRAPVVTIVISVRGHNFTIEAAVSEMGSHDLLLGIDVLEQLFGAGFNISARSV